MNRKFWMAQLSQLKEIARQVTILFVSCGFAFGEGANLFEIIEGNFTWPEAKADAEARGGRLAVLDTQEKIDASRVFLTPNGPTVFIGLTDEEQEGQWKWITGESLELDNWLPGQPGGGVNENYAVIYPNQNSGWNDVPNLHRQSYLFERLESPEAIAVPFGLQPGDQYQLIFVTSADTDALSPNIDDYNAFVQAVADNAGIGTSRGIKWSAIGSTATVNAEDNAPVTAPVYRLDGIKLGDVTNVYFGNRDLLAKPNITENGTIRNSYTWTGTLANGTAGSEWLGSPWVPNTDTIWQGYSGDLFGAWLQSKRFVNNPTQTLPMYALSQPLTVPLTGSNSGKSLSLRKESGEYGRVQQRIPIVAGKRYKAVAQIEGEYIHNNTNKVPELRVPARGLNTESFTVSYDGVKTTIDNVFTVDVSSDAALLSYSLWTVNELIFRKIELIDLETGENLIKNGKFDTGLAFWQTDGGEIDIVDLEESTNYVTEGALLGGGEVSGFGEFEAGSITTLEATADPGYIFTSWTGDANGTSNPLTITVKADLTIGATFAPDSRDFDNDGLTNFYEIVELGSDPYDNDTDDDGLVDGAEVKAGLNILQPESISEAVAFLTAVRDEVISQRDARPTLEEVKDARLGSVLLLPNATTNKVKLRFTIEESNDLGTWTSRQEEAEVDIPLDPGKKFFRFSVKEDDQ